MADHAAEPVTTPPIRAEIGANRLELIESGQARLDTLIEAIAGAEHSIKMLMYMFNPDHVGDEVRDALVAQASRYFDTIFRWSTRTFSSLRSLRRLIGEYSEWRGLLQWKFSGPLSLRNSWWRSIGADMRRAHRLDMVFAYFAPPGAMLRR